MVFLNSMPNNWTPSPNLSIRPALEGLELFLEGGAGPSTPSMLRLLTVEFGCRRRSAFKIDDQGFHFGNLKALSFDDVVSPFTDTLISDIRRSVRTHPKHDGQHHCAPTDRHTCSGFAKKQGSSAGVFPT